MAGKYDDLAEELLKRTNARGVLVLVIGGSKGDGMSLGQRIHFDVAAELNLAVQLPEILRVMASKIEAEQTKPNPEAV
jgi:hypothetical protein